MIFQLSYHGENISEAITQEDAIQIQRELRDQGIRAAISEPWLDHHAHREPISPGVEILLWRTEERFYALLYQASSDTLFDFGVLGIPISQRYTFDHRVQEITNALNSGSNVSSVAERARAKIS
jgi:hypothetical protein